MKPRPELGRYVLYAASCACVGVLMYLAEGPEGLRRGWFLLTLALALRWVDLTFEVQGFAAYRLVPRRLRLQAALENTLLTWNNLRGEPDRGARTLPHLRVAQRVVRDTPMSEKIDRIVASIEGQSVHSGQPDVRAGLQACLAELAAARGTRQPYTRGLILPAPYTLPLSTVFAFGTVLAGEVTQGQLQFTPANGATGLAFLNLFYAMLRLVHSVGLKLRLLRASQAFRTIIISDQPSNDSMTNAAVSFYERCGDTVAVLLGSDVGRAWHQEAWSGLQRVFTDKDRLADALDAFADHADLVVVHTSDAALAAAVREMVPLPAPRRLALGKDGAVPEGFRWIEPWTLRTNPWRLRGRDLEQAPDSIRHPERHSAWSSPWLRLRLLAWVALFWVHGSGFLVILVGLSILARIAVEPIGRRRRSSVSRAAFRAPRAVEFSQRLSPKGTERNLLAVAFVVTFSACYAVPHAIELELEPAVLVTCVLASYAMPQIGSLLVNGTLLAVKWYLDWNFRFVVFRRNTRAFGFAHKSVVMATCGRYGQVLIVGDRSLNRTDEDYGEWRESSQGAWLSIFSEKNLTLWPDAFLHDWRLQVTAELEVADFVVFDWAEDLTDSMRWELRTATERLPSHRILIVHRPEQAAQVQDALATLTCSGAGQTVLALPRGPDDEYIWSNHQHFANSFGAALHQMLSRLTREPRPPVDARPSGVWPLPT